MSVNKLRYNVNNPNKSFNLRILNDWEYSNLSDGYEKYEKEVVKDVINLPFDYEVERFSNEEYLVLNNKKTEINYSFNFFDNTLNSFFNSYLKVFDQEEIYYNANSFKNSFFKLDFYDSTITAKQKNYLTIIIPTYQGNFESVLNPNGVSAEIKKPFFTLDFIGDKEGFFIYWLKKKDFIDIDNFFVSAKFFDGKNGGYRRFTNRIAPPQPFNSEEYFYYKLTLDYQTKTYKVITTFSNSRVGEYNNPIKWFEYINS